MAWASAIPALNRTKLGIRRVIVQASSSSTSPCKSAAVGSFSGVPRPPTGRSSSRRSLATASASSTPPTRASSSSTSLRRSGATTSSAGRWPTAAARSSSRPTWRTVWASSIPSTTASCSSASRRRSAVAESSSTVRPRRPTVRSSSRRSSWTVWASSTPPTTASSSTTSPSTSPATACSPEQWLPPTTRLSWRPTRRAASASSTSAACPWRPCP
mmetsp:Transcript_15693/g.47091  ORF Transcript_15693/g.47091 Transcript_15693/m.47091 type:complete len:215 (+) Transcript_15693:3943-4587(+)